MSKRCGLIFRWAMKRAYLYRCKERRRLMFADHSRIPRNDFRVEERKRFLELIRGKWDGQENSLPHHLGCECLFEFDPGPCSCGITLLAQGRFLAYIAQSLLGRLKLLGMSVYRFLLPQTRTVLCASGWTKSRIRGLYRNAIYRCVLPLPVQPYLAVRGLWKGMQTRPRQEKQ